ncbi:MFS transporter [Amycolatopsis cihanbeyliensis]|uniref:MFS transporter n=1 Tax=Amycolatopsis cihanbeyliensis TaxID=1128664 RepID=UPI00147707E2|nr:MFS transporter [Amycolatopsis cihanbeyliensis]
MANGVAVPDSHRGKLPLRSTRERQIALIVLCVGTLMTVVDSTAVYVALPTMQTGLGISQVDLAWVVNAYLIPFGGLLLFAGRLGDLIGAKRVFLGGLGLFVSASVACGLANDPIALFAARFAQGAGGAFTTAVALGMVVSLFPKERDQVQAFALYAFIGASGAVLGQIAGAGLTSAFGWRWIFFVNVPIGLAVIGFAVRFTDNIRESRERARVDQVGALLLVGSLMLCIYTLTEATDLGWSSLRTLALAAGGLLLMVAFVGWQARARVALIPLHLLRRRNVGWVNLVLLLMNIGPTGMFFLCALYLQHVLGFTVLEVGMAFVPTAVVLAITSLKLAPRLLREVDAKTVLVPSIVSMIVGLALFARIPADGNYLLDVLPASLLIGLGAGTAGPPVLRIALAEATTRDRGLRSGLINTTQQVGAALGLAVLSPIAASVTQQVLADGAPMDSALTDGYRTAFLAAAGAAALALTLAVIAVKPAVPRTGPADIDPNAGQAAVRRRDPTGADNPDFLALGLGGTNMMAMLWSIAMGRRAVGVELRGDPHQALMHWNVNENLRHSLATIDRLMVERYGRDRVPRRPNGELFLLHECFYYPGAADGGEGRADEVIDGWVSDGHIAALVGAVDIVDDRWVDGMPNRSVTTRTPEPPAASADASGADPDLSKILNEPFSFQIGAEDLLILLRRYLEEMSRMDLAAGHLPRCRIFTYHRAVKPRDGGVPRWLRRLTGRQAEPDGFVRYPDGRVGVRIEAIRELDEKGVYRRVRDPGTEVLDLGVPGLFMIAEGSDSDDARRLGLVQDPLTVDNGDGRGPVIAQADYVIGVIAVSVGDRFRLRMASEFDDSGSEHWIRQAAAGHVGFIEEGWIITEVPDFVTFDPAQAGMVSRLTKRDSAEYHAAYRYLLREFYLDQITQLTGIPRAMLANTLALHTPRMISVVAKMGRDPLVAANGVVAGDSFGNGSFLASGGVQTGLLGHASRVGRYWRNIDAGIPPGDAVRDLADGIRADTEAWLEVSRADFAQPPRSGVAARENVLAAARRRRRSIAPFTLRDDLNRLNVHPGRVPMLGLQPLEQPHPNGNGETGGEAGGAGPEGARCVGGSGSDPQRGLRQPLAAQVEAQRQSGT